jgi:hypothetical protein
VTPAHDPLWDAVEACLDAEEQDEDDQAYVASMLDAADRCMEETPMTADAFNTELTTATSTTLVRMRSAIDEELRRRYELARKEARDVRPYLSRRGSKPKKERSDKGVKKGPRAPRAEVAA